jgi:hypothetical protein
MHINMSTNKILLKTTIIFSRGSVHQSERFLLYYLFHNVIDDSVLIDPENNHFASHYFTQSNILLQNVLFFFSSNFSMLIIFSITSYCSTVRDRWYIFFSLFLCDST